MKNSAAIGSLQHALDPPPSSHPRWHRRTLVFIGALFVFRLCYTFVVPLDLVHDEAYYWEWSRRPDWGYFSKPPLVAWLIACSTRLAGSSAFVVRLPAVLLGTCGLYLVYLLGSRLYDRRTGFWSMLICAATPGNAAMSLIMTIDVPLLFFWMAALYAFWRFLEAEADRRVWLGIGIATTGFGLLSKQTMIGFFLSAFLFLLASPRDRCEFRRPAWIVWGLGALTLLMPVVLWNAGHDWVTWHHTRSHFSGETGLLEGLVDCGEFLAGQLGVVSPVTFVLILFVAAVFAVQLKRAGRRERFLLCFSAVPLAAVFLLSAVRRIEPNWPAAFYPGAIVLAVGWALGRTAVAGPSLPGRLLKQAALMGAFFTAAAYLFPFVPVAELTGVRGLDLTARLRGWRDLGRTVGEQMARLPRPSKTTLVVTTGRAAASELAFYLSDQPEVYVWHGTPTVHSQYDIWGGPPTRTGWDWAILTAVDGEVPDSLARSFDRIELRARIDVPIGGGRSHQYRLWRGVSTTTRPAPARLSDADTSQTTR